MIGPDAIGAIRAGRGGDGEDRLRTTSRLMEAQFYEELFKAMRDTVPEGGLLDGGQGEEIFSSFLDRHLAEAQAMKGRLGLGDALYRHFTRNAPAEVSAPTGEVEPS